MVKKKRLILLKIDPRWFVSVSAQVPHAKKQEKPPPMKVRVKKTPIPRTRKRVTKNVDETRQEAQVDPTAVTATANLTIITTLPDNQKLVPSVQTSGQVKLTPPSSEGEVERDVESDRCSNYPILELPIAQFYAIGP